MKIKSVRPLINIKRGWLQWGILKSRHVYENTYISMAKCDLELYQLDLNKLSQMKLKEDTYMEKPKDFEMKGNEDKLYRLSKP